MEKKYIIKDTKTNSYLNHEFNWRNSMIDAHQFYSVEDAEIFINNQCHYGIYQIETIYIVN